MVPGSCRTSNTLPWIYISRPTASHRDSRVTRSAIGAQRLTQGRGPVDNEIIFRPEDLATQRTGTACRNIKRQYYGQPAPWVQEQLQNEAHLATRAAPAEVCEHVSSSLLSVLADNGKKDTFALLEFELFISRLGQKSCSAACCALTAEPPH